MKTKVLRTACATGKQFDLVQLGDGWSPWTHQVATIVYDGKDYGRPGEPICTSRSNFRDLKSAERYFDNIEIGSAK